MDDDKMEERKNEKLKIPGNFQHIDPPDPDEFLLDSGTTSHMSPYRDSITNWQPFQHLHYVLTATGHKMKALGRGDIKVIPTSGKHKHEKLILKDVLYVPLITHNIVALNRLTLRGFSVSFEQGRVYISADEEIISGIKKGGRYLLNIQREQSEHLERTHHVETDIKKDKMQTITKEPETYRDVANLPKAEQQLWQEAMLVEVNNFNKNNTWHPEIPPRGVTPIHTRWTFKVKRDENAKVMKIRARLVAKGFEQQYGHQYDESYAPVIKLTTLRTILVLTCKHDWYIKHIDVDSAFLYGKLKETIYVYAPDSPPDMFQPRQTFRLKAAIYGLKQASNAWHKRLTHSLLEQNFHACESDPCLFMAIIDGNNYFIISHVDDILVIGREEEQIDKIITTLTREYSIKNLGNVTCYLGMHLQRTTNPNTYHITQKDKIQKLCDDPHLKGCPITKTPMLPDYISQKIEDNSPKLNEIKIYQKILGELLYISNTSRPDITLATGILGRSAHSPSQIDWQAITRTVGYLKGTTDRKLSIRANDNKDLVTYTDADWGGDPTTKRSTSGSCHFLYGGLISWSSVRQKNVTLSTAEAEYVAAVEATKETVWINGLLSEITVKTSKPLRIMCDNQSAIAIASSMKIGASTKHIVLKMFYLRELVDNGFLMMYHCGSSNMLADLFTKPLPHPRHNLLTEAISNKNPYNELQKKPR